MANDIYSLAEAYAKQKPRDLTEISAMLTRNADPAQGMLAQAQAKGNPFALNKNMIQDGALAEKASRLYGQRMGDLSSDLKRSAYFQDIERDKGVKELNEMQYRELLEREAQKRAEKMARKAKKKGLQSGLLSVAGAAGGAFLGGPAGAQIGAGLGSAIGSQ